MIVTMAAIASMAGCASPYMTDRGRDAADIFTATAGVGAGGKARVGPLHLGLLFNCAEAGLRGGEVVVSRPFEKSELGTPKSLDMLFFAYGLEAFEGGPLAPDRGKCFQSVTFVYLTAPAPESIVYGKTTKRASGRHAVYSPAPYWTEIEACVGLGGTLRLGFNPGELLDFILGWTTLDIFGDDLESKKLK